MEYTVDYFINKFEAIPENRWWMGNYQSPLGLDKYCAFGHCGASNNNFAINDSIKALSKIGNDNFHPIHLINDGADSGYKQETPKQRVLAFLNDVKYGFNRHLTVVKEEVVVEKVNYVVIDKEIREDFKNKQKEQLIYS